MNIRDNGQIASVTDANGINASYAYNNLGDLTALNYTAPGVPSLSVGFDRAGRVISKAFSTGIMEAYARTLDGMMASKAVIGNNMVPDVAMTYQYASGHTGIEGFSYALDGANVSTEIGYDAATRVSEITSDDIAVGYTYSTNGAPMMEGMTVDFDGGTPLTKNIGWDYVNNRINSISYSVGGSTVASYDYEYATKTYQTPTGEVTVVTDRIGKITREDGTYTEYQYDERNQLASASTRSSDGARIQGLQFGYEYDSIGNMVKGGSLGDDGEPQNAFTANDLNQHETREWGGSLDVMGYAAADATVTVNDISTIRQGEWFYTSVPLSNSISSAEMDITALAVYNDGTQDVVGDVSGKRFVSATTETPTYDARGNLIEDSRFDYTWDGWGRLVTVASKNASPNFKLEFQYYPDGQRASKKYYENEGGWILQREHQYVYDNWNLIYEKVINSDTPTLSYTNTYTWGLDIAGQRNGSYGQSAGGIGGLLAITQVSGLSPQPSTYFPVANHNGDIHKLLDESGNVVEEYTYSPFGELIGLRSQVSLADPGNGQVSLSPGGICPFRFSSKYYDAETELYYYGIRCYDPKACKWLTRDPLQEQGGINLTTFCQNDPINRFDPLGLAIYAFDGTNNDKDNPEKGRWTNVAILWKLYDQSKSRSYIRGVGTGDEVDYAVGGITGQGGAWRLEYMWDELVANFKAGDTEIVIVGFSRGAALAREFANMIAERGDPARYQRAEYTPTFIITPSGGMPINAQTSIEKVEGSAPDIKFMGIFDTVASFGIPGNDVNLGYRMSIPNNVAKVAHAVALNEYREAFPLSSIMPEGQNIDPSGRLVEQKFLGAHSDIGGGYNKNLASLKPLRWMIAQGTAADVKFQDFKVEDFFNTAAGVRYHKSHVPLRTIHPTRRSPYVHSKLRKMYHYK